MEGMCGVERRPGGDEVEIKDFGLDCGAGERVGDDDLLDFGAELVGVRCQWGVGVVAWGDLADEEVGPFGGAHESWETGMSVDCHCHGKVLAYLVQ